MPDEFDPAEMGWKAPLIELIQCLPSSRHWTPSHRKRWLNAVEATIDMVVRVASNDEETKQ